MKQCQHETNVIYFATNRRLRKKIELLLGMKNWKRNLSYICILFGGILALYQQSKEEPNQLLVVFGLGMLMVGVYATSRRIPEKDTQQQTELDDDASV